MRRFFKSKKNTQPEPKTPAAPLQPTPSAEQNEPAPQKKAGMFARLRQGLSRTRHAFTNGLASALLGKKKIDEDLLETIETLMLTADMGVDVTEHVIQALTQKVSRKELHDGDALYRALQTELQNLLEPVAKPLDIHNTTNTPFVILMIGVNGNGKTTTIGKLAKQFQRQGQKVMLAAGDTFRAAAVEQLQAWGERNDVPVVAQQTGADSAAVIFDAFNAAKARGVDVLIADTAGRLHTQVGLMDELKKVVRVLQKIDPQAPHEVMLVLDAGTGQNALRQAQEFKQAVEVSGITLTKLDGTAKGGTVFAIAQQMQLPIRYIGVGEGIDDLRPFAAAPFIQSLFATHEQDDASICE